MNIDDYESLPTTSVSINMTAGALAGVLEHCIMYPLDSVKTRMQHISPSIPSYSIAETFRNMINKEGIMRPIRGVTAVVAGAGPAHALYFASYEFTKEFFTKFTSNNHINYMASGVMATLIHDAVSNPTEVIKQRMQMYNSPYSSVVKCMRDVYKKEGFKAFYRSYATQLVMNIPYQMIHFPTYEFFQNMLNNERRYNAPVHMVAGAAAGATAAAITTPLDVMKTLLNTQETGFTKGMMDAARQIYSMAGPYGFFKGLTARVLYSMPATAICWSTYEFFKFYLCGIHPEKYKSSITGKNSLQPRTPPSTSSITESQLVSDGKLLTVQNGEKETAGGYVLTASPTESVNINANTKANEIATKATTTTTTTISSPNSSSPSTTTTTTPPPPTATPSGPIKSVCELSSTITSPTLNLNTRHTDVEIPFDRKYSST